MAASAGRVAPFRRQTGDAGLDDAAHLVGLAQPRQAGADGVAVDALHRFAVQGLGARNLALLGEDQPGGRQTGAAPRGRWAWTRRTRGRSRPRPVAPLQARCDRRTGQPRSRPRRYRPTGPVRPAWPRKAASWRVLRSWRSRLTRRHANTAEPNLATRFVSCQVSRIARTDGTGRHVRRRTVCRPRAASRDGHPHHRRDRASADADAAEADRDLLGDLYRGLHLLVEVRTDAGITGVGETLARFSPKAYAELIETSLKPRLVGRIPWTSRRIGATMRRALSGRAGGMLFEAIAGVDIALVGHPGQGRRPADPSPARRHGPDGGPRLRRIRELGQRRSSWTPNSTAISRRDSRASR